MKTQRHIATKVWCANLKVRLEMEIYGIINEKGNYEMTPEMYSKFLEDLANARDERNTLKRQLEEMDKALLAATRKRKEHTEDVLLSREAFVRLANKASVEDDCWYHDITVHWHGLYCNCDSLAQTFEFIIGGIEGLIEQIDD